MAIVVLLDKKSAVAAVTKTIYCKEVYIARRDTSVEIDPV